MLLKMEQIFTTGQQLHQVLARFPIALEVTEMLVEKTAVLTIWNVQLHKDVFQEQIRAKHLEIQMNVKPIVARGFLMA